MKIHDCVIYDTFSVEEICCKRKDEFVDHRRIGVFIRKGLSCVKCGITVDHFVLERHKNECEKSRHLNPYAVVNGKRRLMTIDHILPKSLGGLNDFENLQPMCTRCNSKKGNKVDSSI